MKDWKQGETSESPTCELPANARRMKAAGEKLGRAVVLVYGRCEDLDCSGSVSVRVGRSAAADGRYGYVGIWHDGKWFSGGAGGQMGIGYREIVSALKLATEPAAALAAATPDAKVVDIAPLAA